AGHLEQVGTPLEVYQRPASTFVAGFLGDANFIPGTLSSVGADVCTVATALGPLSAARVADLPEKGSPVQCMIRPQALSVTSAEANGPNRIAARVEQSAFLGELLQWHVAAAGGTQLLVLLLPHTADGVQAGATVHLTVPPEQVVVLSR